VLAELAATHQRRHNATVIFQVIGTPRLLTADATLALTRIAQEALVNASKHAPHQPVDVRFDYAIGRVMLVIANGHNPVSDIDSAAFKSINGGYGLAGMRERLLLIEGTLDVGPQNDQWIVTAQVPQ
jgi:signal transduction histidine kinase